MNSYKKVSIAGIIFFPGIICLMHSINKRIANKEAPITGGQYWLWQLGWSAFGITMIGPWIYCAVKYHEMNDARQAVANM